MGTPAAVTRGERRKRATEARLLAAALRVFCARGYDAATTAEMAETADVAAGTFYLHFRDKRAAYESLARDAAHDLLARWRGAIAPGMRIGERVRLALRLAAEFWRADLRRARLLLEGGPSFGSEGHIRFVDEIAAVLSDEGAARRRRLPARALALVVAGLGIELGRLLVAEPGADVEELIGLVARSFASLDA
ncbi:MAG TPA: helix-turn-helix domain-containing protein [Candidatus Binatia bacterium]|nr:helix-turn-helix domain-containing protein [Candidatus Binatia bacterium]